VPYLEHLSSLLLQNNNLKTLPKELWRLSNLQELNLGSNQLETIPEQIGLLSNLRELFIHDNQICSLPTQIGNLEKLVVLDATDNRLEWLPSEILSLGHLKNLWIENNPFTATETTETVLISLKDICIQTIGQLCNTDLESRRAILETSLPVLLVDKSRLLIDEKRLVERCFVCSCVLYQDHLRIIKRAGDHPKVPLQFKACSQACYQKLLQ
jgi:Leucine-rich repeat (LRR) protein